MRPYIFIFIIYFLLFNCSSHIEDVTKPDDNEEQPRLVSRVGKTSAFELGSWNIEWFPKDGTKTINYVKTIIKNLDIDLIAVQEIASVSSFNALLDSLGRGWKGALSNDAYGDGSYQKTGVIYKSAFISLSNVKNIFTRDGYAFPRPPLSARVAVKDLRGLQYDFTLIVLHLKAMGGESNEARRRSACQQLKQYIDTEIASGADPDFIVAGDWNDEIDDPADRNVFQSFLEDTLAYTFLTNSVLSKSSYISNTFNSLIDHILITGDSNSEHRNGYTDVLYLDDEFIKYRSGVSDHRPVVTRFNGFTIELQTPPAADN